MEQLELPFNKKSLNDSKKELSDMFKSTHGVCGFGICNNRIRVLVLHEVVSDILPEHINGYFIECVVSGEIVPLNSLSE